MLASGGCEGATLCDNKKREEEDKDYADGPLDETSEHCRGCAS
jgi:hypothetical protein